jgi:LytS/YehU family sensor histidine kinase
METFTGPGASLDAIAIGLIVSFGYRFSKDWIVNLTEIERLKAERLEMELAFLKSQVDPHFLFNTLNTIYAVALEEGGTKTGDSITKLATLMRYNLHEAKRTFIPVEKEIGYIQKYIELQKFRLTDRNKVDWKVTIDKEVSETTQIAPMLLITFIENAFKYGVSPTENTLINMEIVVDRTSLIMELSNTIIKNAGKKAKGGVGIDNVRKRLEHLYPNRHQLRFGREGSEFHVYLEINLDQ